VVGRCSVFRPLPPDPRKCGYNQLRRGVSLGRPQKRLGEEVIAMNNLGKIASAILLSVVGALAELILETTMRKRRERDHEEY
jgi:hypothetical protein